MGISTARRIGQGVAILIIGMLAGSVILTPAGAHITNFNHLVTKHFYTKKSADERFINVGEQASSAATAKSADTANTAAVATTAGRATNIYSAQVESAGTMLGSVPSGITSVRDGTGFYIVNFPRPLAGCVLSASASTEGDWYTASTQVLVSAFDGSTCMSGRRTATARP